jgi:hypothetical protein
MPVPMPMRVVRTLGAVLLLVSGAACSGDSPITGGNDDTNIDGGGGDINTDLFAPGDAEDDSGEGDGAGDDSGGGGGDLVEEGEAGLERYAPCGLSGAQCAPPLVCVGTCQLPCSAGCPEGEECIELGGFGDAGVCGVRGAEGDDCDITRGLFCEAGLMCVEGACAGSESGGEGGACGGFGEECDDGLVCVFTGFGEGICQRACGDDAPCEEGEVCVGGVLGGTPACFEDCDLQTDPVCSDNVTYQCRAPLGGGDEACLPRLGDPPGDAEFGEPCSSEVACVEGLFCPRLRGGYCTATCSNSEPCPSEPAGAECVNLLLQGACLFTCAGGDASECPEGMVCNDVFGQRLCAWP